MAIGANMTRREQMLVGIAVIAFLLVGAYWYFIYNPKSGEIDTTAAHVDSLEVSNKEASRDLSAGNLKRLQKEAGEYGQSLKMIRCRFSRANNSTLIAIRCRSSATTTPSAVF
jgi:hypothetical protein